MLRAAGARLRAPQRGVPGASPALIRDPVDHSGSRITRPRGARATPESAIPKGSRGCGLIRDPRDRSGSRITRLRGA
ncbi:hypothetical protein M446_6127 [Methylobacterium sp. 4-46]|nr:hypothetical protein M446_6127 [Methylobacterium sp. 4-46]